MKTAAEVLKAIKNNDVKYVDLRFTDVRGKWQHVTFDQTMIDEDIFSDGTMFDGSSIAGWKAINESDMDFDAGSDNGGDGPVLRRADHGHRLRRPRTLHRPALRARSRAASPRKAKPMRPAANIGDAVYFGPEAEFFVFDDVRYRTDPYDTGIYSRFQ